MISPTAAGMGVISGFGRCASGLMLTSLQAAQQDCQGWTSQRPTALSLPQADKRAVVLLRHQAHEGGETDVCEG